MFLKNKVVLITGGSRGIGKAVAEKCLSEGANVIINYKTSCEKVKKLVQEYGKDKVITYKADVSNPEQVSKMIDYVKKTFGHLDGIVNNAGIITRTHNWKNISLDDWKDNINTNLLGSWNLIRFGVDIMNMQIIAVLVLLTLITITVNTILITTTWRISIKQKEEQTKAQQDYYIASTPISIDDMNILDRIVEESFNYYQLLNLSGKDNAYINEDTQQKIIYDVLSNVLSSVSDSIIGKLSLIYKKDYIEDLIARKVQLVVLDYTISINGNYRDDKK